MENLNFALRYLRALRGGSVTRIISLSLGLAVGLLLFSYVNFQLSVNRCIRDHDRIYQLWAHYNAQMGGFSDMLNGLVAPTLMAEAPQVECATRMLIHHGVFKRHEHSFVGRMIIADTCFFDLFGFRVEQGDPHRVLADPSQVMISRSMARRAFGSIDPVGKLLIAGRDSLTVGGVFADLDVNQQLGEVDFLRSFRYVEQLFGAERWTGGDSFPTFLKLRPGASIDEVAEVWERYTQTNPALVESARKWGTTWHFMPIADSPFVESGLRLVAWLLFALGLVTMAVSALNYVLISVSALSERAGTVAMLKVNGARARDIRAIFCWETAVLMGVSLLVAVFLLVSMQEHIYATTRISMLDLFAPRYLWVAAAVCAALFVLAAPIPARVLAAVPVAIAFRGAADARRRWKLALLAVELLAVTLTLSLLVVSALQFHRLRNGDLGYDYEDLTIVKLTGLRDNIPSVCASIEALPFVEAAGVAQSNPVYGYSGQPCYDSGTRELLFGARIECCDERFIPAMGMRMVAGRNFTAADNASRAIVNETYCRMRGWTPEEAVGREIFDGMSLYTIIGVVGDYRTVVSTGEVQPLVLHPMSLFYAATDRVTYYVMIRLRELSTENFEALSEKLHDFESPDNWAVRRFDEALSSELSDIRSYRNIILTVCLIALLVVFLGLAGFLNDEIRRRRREVAIRKVCGASVGEVQLLLSVDFLRVALPAVTLGAVAGRCGAQFIVENFVERPVLHWWLFALAAVVVLAFSIGVHCLRTRRTALSNPLEIIRDDLNE